MTETSYRIEGATGAWEIVISLEVPSHSKLFSAANTSFGAERNTQVLLIDVVMLPVPNVECVRQAVRTDMAMGAC